MASPDSRAAIETVEVSGRRVEISNPGKVYFPGLGATKLDVVGYYLAVADPILRATAGRPAMLQRFPEGALGNSFFQKRVPKGAPEWLQTIEVSTPNGTTSRALVIADLAHILWAVNLGCLGFHLWPFHVRDPAHSDELRIDLDPQVGVVFDQVREAASCAKALLDELGILAYPKTSGNRGLHIYARLESRWDAVEVRAAAVALARELERRRPDLVTANWWKEERGQRVFVDFNQNAPHKTVFGAWSARARSHGQVSTPLSWDEAAVVDPDELTIATVPDRLRRLDDPWAAMPGQPQSLEPLLQLAARDRDAGLHDAPWPPQYPKQPDEPSRVAPSRARKKTEGKPLEPAQALRRIAYLLERDGAETYKVRAFRQAAIAVQELGPGRLELLASSGRLKDIPNVGETTGRVIAEAIAGGTPSYLAQLEAVERGAVSPDALGLRAKLRGDCHSHSDWSDGGSPIPEMAEAALGLGHDYLALTDHSPRLTIARGLTADRLRSQLEVIAALNEGLAPFRILSGIEVDILEDGSLDQDEELLAGLDVVVASVHSKLRMEAPQMTRRMVAAVENPHSDILGHCTGRLLTGKGRAPSSFDAEAVFSACARSGTAVEINSRPERRDPPEDLLKLAVELGCWVSIDTDAHAPGQLEWLGFGCEQAVEAGVQAGSVVNSWPADRLLEWTAGHDRAVEPRRGTTP